MADENRNAGQDKGDAMIGRIKYWLMLIVIPSVLLIDKDGKDKTGHILTGIYVFALLVFLGCLLVTGMANIICIFELIAVNAWAWIMYLWDGKNRN